MLSDNGRIKHSKVTQMLNRQLFYPLILYLLRLNSSNVCRQRNLQPNGLPPPEKLQLR